LVCSVFWFFGFICFFLSVAGLRSVGRYTKAALREDDSYKYKEIQFVIIIYFNYWKL